MDERKSRAAAKAQRRNTSQAAPSGTVDSTLEAAASQYRAGRLAEAKRLYLEALSQHPEQPDALHVLGVISYREGDLAAATELIGKAIAMRPDFPDAHNNLGIALHDQGKFEDAVAAYRGALEFKPGQAEIHYNLGIALQAQGRLDESVAAYHGALECKPGYAEAHNNLGIALQAQGRSDEAVAAYHGALDVKPGYAEAHNNLGTALKDRGALDEAVAAYHTALECKPDYAEAHNNLGIALNNQGKPDDAAAAYHRALECKPDYAEAHNNLGVALLVQGKFDEAITACHKALELKPDYAEAHNTLAAVLKDQGRFEEAVAACRRALELNPAYAEAHNNLGIALHGQDRLDEAIMAYRRALEFKPEQAETHYNLGNVYKDQGSLDDAVAAYHRTLELKPDQAEAHNNLGVALKDQGKRDEAVAAHRRALECKPGYAEAHNNLGIVLKQQGRLDEAAAAYHRALECKPDYAEAHNNLGVALKEQGKLDEAVSAYRRALELKPGQAEIHNNLGIALNERGKPEEAVAAHRKALELQPGYAGAQGMLVQALQRMCDWENLEPESAKLDELVDIALAEGNSLGEGPFTSVTRCDDPVRNFAIAKSASADIEKKISGPGGQHPAGFDVSPGRKIRVGYLSADFHDHPTAHLMAGLFALHDRSGFEITAYSHGPDDGSGYRKKIASDCDRFVDILKLSTIDAARRIREDGIDILVDLKGHTKGQRLEICALRPAPVQVTYLGFPGTTGAGFIDYLMTDRTVTPEDQTPYYSETFAYLPNCYQVNDHGQAMSDKPYARADFGLPGDGFVFCSFNRPYKIEPVMWDAWMRIMRQVEGSVLWLLRDNETAARNLERAAAARGVDPQRIVFAGYLPKVEHLARLKLADLFLDTRVCNAHTTASDALWAGLPLVTLQGRHFASRVGSSLLAAIGLPELIAHGLEDYEALAVRLASDPGELAAIRDKLARNRLVEPLFDTPRFARNLEAAYTAMWRAHRDGEQPRIIDVIEPDVTSPGDAGAHPC